MSKFSDEVEQDDSDFVINVCKQNLGNHWQTNDITIKRFSDGYFNKIFYLKPNDSDIDSDDNKPVVVKLGLKEEFFLYDPLYSLTNTLTISQAKLGPKVLCVFSGGLITEYIESRSFSRDDYENSKIVRLLAQKLARFHSLESPIPRDGTKRWIYYVIDDFLAMDESADGNGGTYDSFKTVYPTIESSDYESLKRLDFTSQMIWIKNAILSSEKILVLSHCDLNRGNILIHEKNQNLDLFLIDFDFCSYNYRGMDFGRFFSSWKQEDPNFGYEDYPTDEQMAPFIDAYIQEQNLLTHNQFSKSALNTRENIIKEAKLFTLAGILIDVLFCIWKVGVEPSCVKEFLGKADKRYAFYLTLKERFQNEKSI